MNKETEAQGCPRAHTAGWEPRLRGPEPPKTHANATEKGHWSCDNSGSVAGRLWGQNSWAQGLRQGWPPRSPTAMPALATEVRAPSPLVPDLELAPGILPGSGTAP